jgi:hypothetical protein
MDGVAQAAPLNGKQLASLMVEAIRDTWPSTFLPREVGSCRPARISGSCPIIGQRCWYYRFGIASHDPGAHWSGHRRLGATAYRPGEAGKFLTSQSTVSLA